MGEHAEMQWRYDLSRGIKANIDIGEHKRNEISTYCEICGKGIRHIKGCTKESLAQHMKAKHKGTKA